MQIELVLTQTAVTPGASFLPGPAHKAPCVKHRPTVRESHGGMPAMQTQTDHVMGAELQKLLFHLLLEQYF